MGRAKDVSVIKMVRRELYRLVALHAILGARGGASNIDVAETADDIADLMTRDAFPDQLADGLDAGGGR